MVIGGGQASKKGREARERKKERENASKASKTCLESDSVPSFHNRTHTGSKFPTGEFCRLACSPFLCCLHSWGLGCRRHRLHLHPEDILGHLSLGSEPKKEEIDEDAPTASPVGGGERSRNERVDRPPRMLLRTESGTAPRSKLKFTSLSLTLGVSSEEDSGLG